MLASEQADFEVDGALARREAHTTPPQDGCRVAHASSAPSFEFVTRHRALDRPEYLFEIDEYRRGADQFLYAHLRVFKFSPSVMKRILAEWRAFRAIVAAPLFAIGEVDDAKWERFVTHLGFEPAIEVVCLNGERRRMFRHYVRLQPNPTEPTAVDFLGH